MIIPEDLAPEWKEYVKAYLAYMQESASRFGEKFTEERKISLVDKLINPPPKMPGAERLQVLFDEIDELIYGDRDGGRPKAPSRPVTPPFPSGVRVMKEEKVFA